MDYTKLVQTVENLVAKNHENYTQFLSDLKGVLVVAKDSHDGNDVVNVILQREEPSDPLPVPAPGPEPEPVPEPVPDPVPVHKEKMKALQEKLADLKKLSVK